eukprot:1185748-Prorocentrum_minimum.AAC.4
MTGGITLDEIIEAAEEGETVSMVGEAGVVGETASGATEVGTNAGAWSMQPPPPRGVAMGRGGDANCSLGRGEDAYCLPP